MMTNQQSNIANAPLRAKPEVIKMWAGRTKCWMCKHRFEKPVILPVEIPTPGKLQPNYNTEVLFHLQGTHGVPPEAVTKMIFNSIYCIENTMQSVYGEKL